MKYTFLFWANALLGTSDDPQTLNEFIDWLTDKDGDPDIIEIIQRNKSTLSNKPAISLLIEQDSGYKKAIYALGKETGVGFFCTYLNEATMNEYADKYGQMIMSFKITANLDGEVAIMGTEECGNLMNGLITPLKDFQTFIDNKYTEVTVTSREAWDKSKLPKQVVTLENKGHNCYPMPSKFENSNSRGGVMAEPMVTEVEWTCELEYNDWKYLENSDTDGKQATEKAGFTCQKEACFTNSTASNFIWLCAK